MADSCFIVMPIGTQKYGEIEYKNIDLKKKYDDLIKEAILKIKPEMEIFRADDISMPGSITNDIFIRLMHSRYVIADISLPNPNVFYELGIRHAIKPGTILIKDKSITNSVFDISHLRHIEYENTPSGLKELSTRLMEAFTWIDANPFKFDSQFLEIASYIKFQYPKFANPDEEKQRNNMIILNMMTPLMQNPEIMKMMMNPEITQEEKNAKLLELATTDPKIMANLMYGMINLGKLKI